ncbi:helix-turn-helix domain-containing protein, partial [Priestia sp. SIMBA_032]|uniref:helix-turn-helix domain-containing protein n=1 Tax=Priestia sp. SIMBA_032 TaxID=3085775 RepID=UPI00397D1635
MTPSYYLSADEVADELGLHVRTVRTYIRDGRLRAARVGKQYRITRADLAAFAAGAGNTS